MPFVSECIKCGWKELRLNMTLRQQGILLGAQAECLRDGNRGLCYRCRGEVKIHQLKFKLLQKIIARFPGRPCVQTWMSWEDVADGMGELVGIVVVDEEGRKKLAEYEARRGEQE